MSLVLSSINSVNDLNVLTDKIPSIDRAAFLKNYCSRFSSKQLFALLDVFEEDNIDFISGNENKIIAGMRGVKPIELRGIIKAHPALLVALKNRPLLVMNIVQALGVKSLTKFAPLFENADNAEFVSTAFFCYAC